MEGKKFSLKNVMSNAISSMNGKCRKIFAVSIMLYMMFLISYFLTRSFIISFVVYSIFLPSAILYFNNPVDKKAESVFKIGKSLLSVFLISILFVFTFGMGLILAIFPGIIIFANYALVFDEAKNGDVDAISAFKNAKQSAKGYRGKIALLSLAFLLILILLVGFGILLSWLFSLFIPALTYNSSFIWSFLILPLFSYVGAFLGVSLFLIFVLPVELIAISKIKDEIDSDKLYKLSVKDEDEPSVAKTGDTKKEESEVLKESEQNDSNLDDDAKESNEDSQPQTPSDYIF